MTTTTAVEYRQTSTGRTVLYGPAEMLVPGATVYVHCDLPSGAQRKAELVGSVLATRDGMAQALIGAHQMKPAKRRTEDEQDFSTAQYRAWRS